MASVAVTAAVTLFGLLAFLVVIVIAISQAVSGAYVYSTVYALLALSGPGLWWPRARRAVRERCSAESLRRLRRSVLGWAASALVLAMVVIGLAS